MASKQKKYDIVLKLLSERVDSKELSDNDRLLCYHFWNQELEGLGYNISKLSYINFMRVLTQNKITSADTITRIKRKILENNPSLRGLNYTNRLIKQGVVKRDLHNLKNTL